MTTPEVDELIKRLSALPAEDKNELAHWLLSRQASPPHASLKETKFLGDRQPGDYVARLFYEEEPDNIDEQSLTHWIGFDLVKIEATIPSPLHGVSLGSLGTRAEVPQYMRREAHNNTDVTSDIDDADLAAWGHVKWDGCMEIRIGMPSHFCNRLQVEQFLDAILQVRRLCAEKMAGTDVAREYERRDTWIDHRELNRLRDIEQRVKMMMSLMSLLGKDDSSTAVLGVVSGLKTLVGAY